MSPLSLCPACLLASALAQDDEPCPFQVVAPIGESPQGVTYLAQPFASPRDYVALKILGPRKDTDVVLSRYRHWRPALARVQHQSVARLLDVGLTGEGRLYIATEYVAGWSLATAGSRKSFGHTDRLAVAQQLADAVGTAHEAGIVHLALGATKVKVSTSKGPRATVLGLGVRQVLDGADGDPEVDRVALARLRHDLGVGL